MAEREGWTDDEARALAAWTPPEPPSGLAERAMAVAVAAAPRGRRGWRLALAFAAGAALAAGALLVAQPEPTGERAPREIRGSEARFTVAIVEEDEMRNGSAALLGATAGALISAAVVVTVYEGRVVASTSHGPPVVVRAGERVVMGERSGPLAERADETQSRVEPGGTANPLPSASGPVEPAGPTPTAAPAPAADACGQRTTQLKEEVETLREEVAFLKKAVAVHEQMKRDDRTYGLSEAKLLELAEQCELRWDNPPIRRDEPQLLSDETAEMVGLTAAERKAVDEEMVAANARLLAAVQDAFLALGGDAKLIEELEPEALMRQIHDLVEPPVVQAVYQRISAEKAGLTPPALPPGQAPSPLEGLMRALTSAGDALQQAIADRIGPELASDLRDAREGWGSRSKSSAGCPE